MAILLSVRQCALECGDPSDMQAGNSQGAIILFDVETSEHINTRTIFDPITTLAPASDCRTFAIG